MAATISIREYLSREDQQLSSWAKRTLLRLELAMDYSDAFRRPGHVGAVGVAGIKWSVLHSSADPEKAKFKAVLASMLYAKILGIDVENRSGLFGRVDDSLRKCSEFGGWSKNLTPFAKWSLTLPTKEQQAIWPWQIVSWEEALSRREGALIDLDGQSASAHRVYSATLLEGPYTNAAPDGWWLSLQMPDAHFQRVLLPSVVLLALTSLLTEASEEEQPILVALLKGVNRTYGSPDRIEPGLDALVVGSVLRAMQRPPTTLGTGNPQPKPKSPESYSQAPADILEDRLKRWLHTIETSQILRFVRGAALVIGVLLLAVYLLPDTNFRGGYYWPPSNRLGVGIGAALVAFSLVTRPKGESI